MLWFGGCPSAPEADSGVAFGTAPETDCVDGIDNNGNGRPDCADEACVAACDADGDGFFGLSFGGDDCDDSRATSFPRAPEVCNGFDDDCDGFADDQDVSLDGSTRSEWHPDLDADGFGAKLDWVTSCEAPYGYLGDASDCDDTLTIVSPTAGEVCDGLDNDCDGLYDDDDASLDLASLTTWYADVDGDGRGDTLVWLVTCFAPAGYIAFPGDCDDHNPLLPGQFWEDVDEDGVGAGVPDPDVSCMPPAAGWVPFIGDPDCDDSDPSISPAAQDVCTNDIDENCDGQIVLCGLEGEWDLDEAGAIVNPGVGEQLLGRDLSGGLDIGGTPAPDLVVASQDFVAFMDATEILGKFDTAVAFGRLLGEPGDDFGTAFNLSGDVDGDGVFDVFVGGPGDADGGVNAGAVWLALGPVVGELGIEAWAASKWHGPASETQLGAHSGFGKLNLDNKRDFVLGGPGYDDGTGVVGGLWITDYDAAVVANVDDVRTAKIVGDTYDSGVGLEFVVLGDRSGDGLDELAVAAPGHDGAAVNAGLVALFYGPIFGDLTLNDAWVNIRGAGENMRFGTAISSPGDLDGDGSPDLLAGGAEAGSGDGGAWGWFFPLLDDSVLDAALVLTGSGALGAGAALNIRDLDGDGSDDVVVGNDPNQSTEASRGHVWVIYGPMSGSVDLETESGAVFRGAIEGDEASVTTVVDDIDGDGYPELLIGGPGANKNAGAAYILGGGPL